MSRFFLGKSAISSITIVFSACYARRTTAKIKNVKRKRLQILIFAIEWRRWENCITWLLRTCCRSTVWNSEMVRASAKNASHDFDQLVIHFHLRQRLRCLLTKRRQQKRITEQSQVTTCEFTESSVIINVR